MPSEMSGGVYGGGKRLTPSLTINFINEKMTYSCSNQCVCIIKIIASYTSITIG